MIPYTTQSEYGGFKFLIMRKITDLTREELIEVADLFLDRVHSDGFKSAEAKNFLNEDDYWFLGPPKENWKEDTIQYLNNKGFELPTNQIFKT